MNIIIETGANLDPTTPGGNKNIQLLLSSVGIRSQVDFNWLSRNKNKWLMDLTLERPDYWGKDLESMYEDLNNLVLTDNKKPYPFVDNYKITRKEINIETDKISEKAL